ncbi:ferredoxin Fd1 [Cryptosporidium sp. chipmunk genotype I]|uniref:ferredoxin Fd1 n=1 Tax=Cryptosporidium sp. chipmunk genotype I TaxID=1280935 RepID=UPI00351A6E85|nr:ferredoxin Fd1 [Cryptosporidium sp. chipmunk genotype I]
MLNNLILRISKPISSGISSTLPCFGKRALLSSCKRFFHSDPQLWSKEDHPKIKLSFILRSGEKKVFNAPKNVSLLEAAQHEELDIEGACEASLACSTCHVILDKEVYNELEPPSEREEDMLDMAPQVCETSRLACQINVDERLTKGNIRLPNMTRNFYVDGFKPLPH